MVRSFLLLINDNVTLNMFINFTQTASWPVESKSCNIRFCMFVYVCTLVFVISVVTVVAVVTVEKSTSECTCQLYMFIVEMANIQNWCKFQLRGLARQHVHMVGRRGPIWHGQEYCILPEFLIILKISYLYFG